MVFHPAIHGKVQEKDGEIQRRGELWETRDIGYDGVALFSACDREVAFVY
jgi:hypothetical protein